MGLSIPTTPRSAVVRELASSVLGHDTRRFLRALWWERFLPDEIPAADAAAIAHAKAFLLEREHPNEPHLSRPFHEIAVSLAPANPIYWSNYGRCLVWLDRTADAIAAFERAVALGGPPDCRAALADARALSGDLVGAMRDDRAVADGPMPEVIDPDVANNCAFAALRAKSYRRGWRWMQARKGSLHEGIAYSARPFPKGAALWDGTPTDRPIVVLWEQGQGDTLMLLRWLPWVATRTTAGVFLEVQPSLVNWCRDLPATVVGVTTDDRGVRQYPATFPRDPLVCWTFDLPFLSGMREASDLPAPYAPAVAPARLTPRAVVVHLMGARGHKNQRRRSLAPAQWPAVFEAVRAAGFVPVSVQPDAEYVEACTAHGVETIAVGDWMDTAAVVRAAAGVLTVDTGLAHLAGSLGAPTVTLLDICAEWRWGLTGTRTPWYPSMHIARQATPGVWPIEDALTALKRVLPRGANA